MGTNGGGIGQRQLIIEEIVVVLRPWSQSEQDIPRRVSDDLDKLRETVDNAKANLPNAANIKNAALQVRPVLTKLIRILRKLPDDHPFFNEPTSPWPEFLHRLEQTSEICEFLAHYKPPNKNADIRKNFCAFFAYGMMSALSKNKPTGTADGRLRTISSLLYQAITGQPEVDLKRACDLTLRAFKSLAKHNKNKPVTPRQSI
jgi:hypothetical protein